MSTSLADLFRRYARDTLGNATMEFVIVFPFLVYIVMVLGEIGVLIARSSMLDRGVGIAVRELRVGAMEDPSHDALKESICEHAFLVGSCNDAVMLELVPLEEMTAALPGQLRCIDRTEEVEPSYNFDPGARSQIMFVRACLIVDPIFPGSGIGALLPKDASGGYRIVSQSAFVNEPS